MKVIVGSDHAGFLLKEEVVKWMKEAGHVVEDIGCHNRESCDYPDYAVPLARAVAEGHFDRGVLVCGTGVGMAIAANRIPGARAVNCSDIFSARSSREHNNANILTLGERVLGIGLALDILKKWIETEFTGEARHTRRLDKIESLSSKSSS